LQHLDLLNLRIALHHRNANRHTQQAEHRANHGSATGSGLGLGSSCKAPLLDLLVLVVRKAGKATHNKRPSGRISGMDGIE
jgi:hypothetical protein